jgi:hypothetical protein
MGVFYPPNLTPDAETGLGKWSDAEIITAFTTGMRPDGRQLAPMMPWMSYAHINADDASALVAYLRSLPPVKHKVPGPFAASDKPAAPYFTVIARSRRFAAARFAAVERNAGDHQGDADHLGVGWNLP